MKTLVTVLLAILICTHFCAAQNLNHPTVEQLQASYKPSVPPTGSSQPGSGVPDIKVQAKVVITLKNNTDAVKLFLKITDKQSHVVIYEVSYPVNSATVTRADGLVLFSKENGDLQITCPDIISLKPYVYDLYTEDAKGAKTSVYTVIQ